VILEIAAGLAGMTIVTVNPALRSGELAHAPGQSRADGIFLRAGVSRHADGGDARRAPR
jgi:fatty-acyl-CoA synthase